MVDPLSIEQIFRGSFSLVFVIISVFIGLRLISKYFKYQAKSFIAVGLT